MENQRGRDVQTRESSGDDDINIYIPATENMAGPARESGTPWINPLACHRVTSACARASANIRSRVEAGFKASFKAIAAVRGEARPASRPKEQRVDAHVWAVEVQEARNDIPLNFIDQLKPETETGYDADVEVDSALVIDLETDTETVFETETEPESETEPDLELDPHQAWLAQGPILRILVTQTVTVTAKVIITITISSEPRVEARYKVRVQPRVRLQLKAGCTSGLGKPRESLGG